MEIKAGRPPVATGGQRLEKNCSSLLSMESIPQIGRDGQVILFDGVRYVRVGRIEGDVLRKDIRRSHLLQHPCAICVQASVLSFLEEYGISTVQVHILDSGQVLEASVAAFKRGLLINRGFGEQVALPLSHWRVIDPRQQSLGLEVS